MLNYRFLLYAGLLLLQFKPGTAASQNIEVLITGIRSSNGQMAIGVFKNDESFQAEKPFVSKKFLKKNISNGAMTVSFDLEAGTYGLSLLDDEDKNNEMNYSFFRIPEEGFGFSNYYLNGLSKPNFDKFKFEVKNNQKQKIIIRIRYM